MYTITLVEAGVFCPVPTPFAVSDRVAYFLINSSSVTGRHLG